MLRYTVYLCILCLTFFILFQLAEPFFISFCLFEKNLSLLSTAMLKHHDQKQLGNQEFIWLIGPYHGLS